MPAEYDYIVVGAGAGGGPLACRLAQDPARYRVALLDAGNDPARLPDGRENFNYSVPVLHGRATEDPQLSWSFFVRHYTDDARQARDTKIYPPPLAGQPPLAPAPDRHGIFYPRAAALGGCTAHNAMITLYPHNEDWEFLRQLTGDQTWSPDNMRRYFENIEDCRYAPMVPNEGRHGFGNWLSTSLLDVRVLLDAAQDRSIQAIILGAVKAFVADALVRIAESDDAELQAMFERLGIYAQVMQTVAARLPAARQADVARLAKAIAVGKSDVDRFKAKFAPLRHQRRTAFLTGDLRRIGQDALDLAVEGLIERFREELLGGTSLGEIAELLVRHVDPNDWRIVQAGMEGLFAIPLATDGVRRSSPCELIRATLDNCPYRLEVLPDVLVTRVVFEGTRAVGVRYVRGRHQYFASPLSPSASSPKLGPEQEIRVRREVILAGGTFNTPQLLMLSGIGPKDVLDKWKIKPVANRDWPGVGKNLQDRYEVTVVSEMQNDFGVLEACKFDTPHGNGNDDPCFVNWRDRKAGVYTTNGALFGIIKRSSQAEHLVPAAAGLPPPDLFIFGLLGNFKGYAVGYAAEIETRRNILTWAILKGHTRNRAGEVVLRSDDPRVPPLINFRNFDDGNAPAGSEAAKDAEAILEGIEFVLRMLKKTGPNIKATVWPNVALDNLDDPVQRTALKEYIMNETWGHHACGTCQIGNPAVNENAVLDGDFRVLGVQGLRVVDASVFPRIPGFFIVTPIYMISEKAAEVILRDARGVPAAGGR